MSKDLVQCNRIDKVIVYNFRLFCEKPLDTQNFEAHFTLFQKRFNKNDYLSGAYCYIIS